jgi:hypothetical protein
MTPHHNKCGGKETCHHQSKQNKKLNEIKMKASKRQNKKQHKKNKLHEIKKFVPNKTQINKTLHTEYQITNQNHRTRQDQTSLTSDTLHATENKLCNHNTQPSQRAQAWQHG